MEPEGLVDIVMPAYNRGHKILHAVKSVQRQTYSGWRLIVVDDQSRDNTSAVITALVAEDSRIKLVCRKKNGGPAAARNTGIALCRASYLAFLDSDDEWAPDHLANSLEVLEQSDVDATIALWKENKGGQLHPIDAPWNGTDYLQKALVLLKPRTEGTHHYMGYSLFKHALLEDFFYNHINSLVVKRSTVNRIGFFDPALRLCEDLDFLWKIYFSSRICFLQEYHFIYNYGEDNIYAFQERIDPEPEAISRDRAVIEKFLGAEKYKVIMRIPWLNRTRKNLRGRDRAVCVAGLKKYIAEKYFLFGYVCRRLKKLRACFYFMKSFLYSNRIDALAYLGNTLLPSILKIRPEKKPEFNLW